MHLIADAADIEDDKILAVAIDQAFELADHRRGPTVRKLPSPLRGGVGGGGAHGQSDSGLPPSPTLPRKGGGSKEARRPNPPPPCGEGSGVGVPRAPTFIIPRPPSAAALRVGGDARA